MPKRKPPVTARITISFTQRKGRHDAEISVKGHGHVPWSNSKNIRSRESGLDALHKAVAEVERAAHSIRGARPIGIESLDYFQRPGAYSGPS